MPQEIVGSPQFHAFRLLRPLVKEGSPRKNRQVSESNAREIREDAGQAGKGFEPTQGVQS
jgi:hypothetical protein